MNSHLLPTTIIDKNGQARIVYKTSDGRGRPNSSERNEYKNRAKTVPEFSPYKVLNDIYVDDFHIADADIQNGISHVRIHEDGVAELIGFNVESNIELTKNDRNGLVAMWEKYTASAEAETYEPETLELESGGSVRMARDGALVFDTGTEKSRNVNDLPSSSSGMLIEKLRNI